MNVRTRMAPSPTGEYHIGSLRTMLYNYAFAKKNSGKFILRIEDTDQNRLVEGALERMLQVIKDYGLSWDEGPEIGGPFSPYIQSERTEIYKQHAKQLVENGHAYYCFCSPERLEEIRDAQRKSGSPVTKYDRHCRKFTKEEALEKVKAGENHVVRFKMPDNQEISFEDLFLGKITINSNDLDDYVLLKSDGFPTYHLAVVIDDRLMEMSHILRGVEWLPSTPKHILLYRAFGWNMPITGHLPNLKEVGANKKLSKRSGTVDALMFLKEGYLPEAMLNFLMFLGWNPGTDKEIYTLEDFINDFSLEKVHKSDLVAFDREKLAWYNGMYIRKMTPDALWDRIVQWAQKFGVDLEVGEFERSYIVKVVSLIQERLGVLGEFTELTSYFFADPQIDNDLLVQQSGDELRSKEILTGFVHILQTIDEESWTSEYLDNLCHSFIAEKGYKPREAFMTLRVAVTGQTTTPPIFDVLSVLGKKLVLNRLQKNL